jgi:hypothetical protein
LVLVPEGHVLASVRSDYRAMENMIFGEMPHIDQILEVLQTLQEEISALCLDSVPRCSPDN